MKRLEKNQLIIASAGHPAPYLIKNGNVTKINVAGTILGLNPKDKWEQVNCSFENGDQLLIFSDGILELKNSEEEFLEDHLIEEISKQSFTDNRSYVKKISNTAKKFTRAAIQIDDQTIICINKK